MPYIFKNGFTKMAKSKKSNLERWMIEYDQHLNSMLEAKITADIVALLFEAVLDNQEVKDEILHESSERR